MQARGHQIQKRHVHRGENPFLFLRAAVLLNERGETRGPWREREKKEFSRAKQ